MNATDFKDFWDKQTASLHRGDDAGFYRHKAAEHAFLLTPDERAAGCVDLGCGAGELLAHFMDHVTVKAGIDYSQSMLDQAATVLAGRDVALLNIDLFDHLETAPYAVWTTTGAINQYLDETQMDKFLDMFVANDAARSLFLFDCVDPLRYVLMHHGISYRATRTGRSTGLKALLRPAYHAFRRTRVAARLALGRFGATKTALPGPGMGYGYPPRFWIEAAARRGLQIGIVSSQLYEYRYHVALRKDID